MKGRNKQGGPRFIQYLLSERERAEKQEASGTPYAEERSVCLAFYTGCIIIVGLLVLNREVTV
jgi:hypothetical protein